MDSTVRQPLVTPFWKIEQIRPPSALSSKLRRQHSQQRSREATPTMQGPAEPADMPTKAGLNNAQITNLAYLPLTLVPFYNYLSIFVTGLQFPAAF